MASAKTITINGRTYDAVTGMLLDNAKEDPKPAPKATAKKEATKPRSQTAAGSMHSSTQRSKTLVRRAAKKPTPTAKQSAAQPASRRHMDIARSAQISRFAAHPVTKPEVAAPAAKPSAPKAGPVSKAAALTATPSSVKSAPAHKPQASVDRPPQLHPAAVRALAKTQAKKQQAAPAVTHTPKQTKDTAIAKAMSTPTKKPTKAAKKKLQQRQRKLLIVAIIVLAFIVLAITAYKVFPGISVSIAASRAGITASYPEYTPDGYALSQPVTFKDGEVGLTFKSNSSDRAYTITQQRSSWDSSSVLDNIVQPAAGNNYMTTKERGLTIFTYGNNATWMNGGLLYTISGDTQLSGDQVRRIATSL